MSPFICEVIGENTDQELNKLQGTWIMVSGEWDGKKIPDEDVTTCRKLGIGFWQYLEDSVSRELYSELSRSDEAESA